MNIASVLIEFRASYSAVMLACRAISGAIGSMASGIRDVSAGLGNLFSFGGHGLLLSGLSQIGKAMLLIGSLAVVAGAAVTLAFGIHAVNASRDFQQGMIRLVTGAGDVTDNMTAMGNGILAVSVQTGVLTTGTDGLNAAMYKIISSGQRGAQALETLKAAAQGSVIEQAKLSDVTQVLTTLQHNFGINTYSASQYMDGMIAAVAHGNITLEALSSAMSPILPQAHELGVHFADVAAAMSLMTVAGVPADQAATSLRFIMQSMILPTKASSDAMIKWGLDTNKVAAAMKVSLPDALQMYIDAAKRAGAEGSKPFIDALASMVGGGQRAAKALFTLSQNMGEWRNMISLVNAAMKTATGDVIGWQVAQMGFNVQMQIAHAALDALLISVGMQLLPYLTKLIGLLVPIIAGFAQWVVQSGAVTKVMDTIVGAIGRVIAIGAGIVGFFQRSELATNLLKGSFVAMAVILASVLVPALWAVVVAAGAAVVEFIILAAPFILVGAAVAIVVAAFIHFYNTSAGFKGVVDTIVGALKTAGVWLLNLAGYLINQIGPAIAIARQFFIQLWGTLQQGWSTLQTSIAWLIKLGQTIWTAIAPFVMNIITILKGQFIPVWQQLIQTWRIIQPLLAQLGAAFSELWRAVSQLAAQLATQVAPAFKIVADDARQLWAIIGPQLLPALEALGMVIGGILLVSLGLLIGVLLAITGALAMFLRGLMVALAGVIQFVTGLVQIFSGVVALISDIFTGKWEKIAGDLQMIWQGIQNAANGFGNMLIGIFVATFGAIFAAVQGFVQGVITYFTTLYHTLVGGSIVPDMCRAIIATFTAMIASVLSLVSGFIRAAIALFVTFGANAVMAVLNATARIIAGFNALRSQGISIVQSLVSAIRNILSTLIGIAASAASGFINSLVGGINAGIGRVGGAVNNLVATVRSLLPFSPAKTGPLKDLDKTGPGLVNTFASGIMKSAPTLHAAMMFMLAPYATTLGRSGGTTGSTTIVLNVDGSDLAKAIGPDLTNQLRIQVRGSR